MEVLDFLLDPLRSGIDRRALAEIALVGAFCGALGFWVVTERLTYPAESLAHGLLPGLVLAALAGASLLAGALGGALAAALLIALAGRDERIGADNGTAVAVTGLIGLGVLLALARDSPQRLTELLFGDPLGVTDADLTAAAGLLGLGVLLLAALHRPLTALAFDRDGAAPLGLHAGRLRVALLLVLAIAIAVAVQGLGALLVLAVLVAPPLAVRSHARSPGRAMAGGALVAVLAGLVGLEVSFHAGSATGATVALALCAAAALGGLVPRRGRAAGPSGARSRWRRRTPATPGRSAEAG